MAAENITPEQLEKLVKLYQEVDYLSRHVAVNMAETAKNAGVVNKTISRLETELSSMNNSFGSMAKSLKDSIQEFSKYNTIAGSTKRSFQALQSISSRMLSDQSGYLTLSEKEIKNLRQKTLLEAQNLQLNIASGQLTKEQLSETNDVLSKTNDLIVLIDARLVKEKEITRAIGVTGNALKGLSKIPGIGNMLKTEDAIQDMKDLARVMQSEGKNINSFSNKLKIAGTGLKTAFGGIKESLTDPVSILTFIITQGLKANKQTVELGKALGRESSTYRENLAEAARSSTNLNVTTENLVKAFNEISKATGFAYEYSVDQLTTQVKLTEQVGLQADEAAQIQRFGVLNNKTSEATYSSFIKGLVAARNQLKVGIDFKATLAEAVKVSGQLAANLGFNPETIAKAVVQTKALGLTFDQLKSATSSLLDFGTSLENELKAELLTGKQLNLERARAAALAGDQVTLADELAKNIGTAADFTKMNVLQQNALATSMGMTSDQLAETLRKREEAIKSGKSLAQITDEEAKAAIERQSIQDKFAQSILKLQDFFGNLVAGPVGQLLDSLTKIVGLITDVLQPVLNIVFKPIAYAVGLLGKMEGVLKGILAVYIGIKAAQLTSNALKAINIAMLVTEAATENEKLSVQNLQFLLSKQSLGVKIAAYAMNLKDVVVSGAIAAYEAIKKSALVAQLAKLPALIGLKSAEAAVATEAAAAEVAGAEAISFGAATAWIVGGLAAVVAAMAMFKGPKLAKGGIVTGEINNATIGEAGPEAIIPLNSPKADKLLGNNASVDLTPMIAAINEVRSAVNSLVNRPIYLSIDGKNIGTALVQGSHKVA
jgi:sporulation protein YlmC with PRC-barrel domain